MTGDNHTDNIVVSFCIASYNRYEVLKELIDELLALDNNRFEIVVSDDRSPDCVCQKLAAIDDPRLKLYENRENVGSLQNICEALEKGSGRWLFYVNDRDTVDASKVERLIETLEDMAAKGIAFGCCFSGAVGKRRYEIYKAGEAAMLQFACRIDHPTGYFFSRSHFKEIPDRRRLFCREFDSDFGFTYLCALLAADYDGGGIYGNVCNVWRKRIDFKTVRSGFYNDRKDKRLWYTPQVQLRELKSAYFFLKRRSVPKSLLYAVLIRRFEEYLHRVVIDYKDILADPSNTLHYGIEPPRSQTLLSFTNGFYLWISFRLFLTGQRTGRALRRKTDILFVQTCRRFFDRVFQEFFRFS